MNLQQLFHYFNLQGLNSHLQQEVTGLYTDSRQVKPGSVFFAVKGNSKDGHDNIPEALEKGAIAIVCSDTSRIPVHFEGSILQIHDVRNVVSLIAGRFYQFPANDLFTVGVTGTNGKTSITYLVEALLNRHGLPTAVMGTINHRLGDQIWPTEMTTPDPILLQERLLDFKKAGAKAVVMEVSSHALDQKRVESVAFDVGIFTNLTRDHLDYHKTMPAYHAAKQRLFTDLMWKSTKSSTTAIINTDDVFGRKLKIADTTQLLTYGKSDADFQFRIIEQDWSGTTFKLKSRYGDQTIKAPLLGEHNVYNTVAAIAAAYCAQASLEKVQTALEGFRGIPGRLQKVPTRSRHVLVDYAHTPDALEKVLILVENMRNEISKNSKIICVFGCGGDRDPGKRPLMGQVAEKYSDVVVMTSDNPRTEDPEKILNDIELGFTNKQIVKRIVDRRAAIREALSIAGAEDIILIAGKGHENYQILGTQKVPFDDYQVALQEGS